MLSSAIFYWLVATNCYTGYNIFIHNNGARENSQQAILMQTVFNYRHVVLLNKATLSLLPQYTHMGMLSIFSIPNSQLNVSHIVLFTQRSTLLQHPPRNLAFENKLRHAQRD